MAARWDRIWMGSLIMAALMGSVWLSIDTPYMVVLAPAAAIFAIMLLNNSQISLLTTILLLPLMGSVVMDANFIPIPGAKPSNLILMLALAGFLLNAKINASEAKLAVVFYAGSLMLLVAAALRADYVAPYAIEFWNESYTPVKFFISHGIIPALRTIPYIMIVLSIRHRSELYRLTKYLAFSLMLFSTVIIGIYLALVPAGSDFQLTRDIIADYLGMHGNNLADFMIIGFPLILSMALDKENPDRKWFYLASVMIVVASAITYSRAAYLMIVLSVLAVMLLLRSYKLLIPVLIIGLMISMIMPSVVDRAMTGFETRDPSDLTAGRTDLIWEAVFNDAEKNLTTAPERIIFGYGRYGVIELDDFKNNRMIRTNQAHNMYIDTFVNTGIVGLAFYVFFFLWILFKLIVAYVKERISGENRNIYLISGLLISISGFLIRGMTDSFFLPQLTNSFMYIAVAIAFITIQLDVDGPAAKNA